MEQIGYMKYSIVIPFKDEESNVEDLVNEIEPVMEKLGDPWELIGIDDGSSDQTGPILKRLSEEKPYLQLIAFDRNYGQSSAFDAGFRAAKGEFVITLDGDRQNDPNDIPKLAEVSDQYDLICGQRKKRKDPPLKKIISSMANFVRSRLCKDGIQDTGCSLKIYRKECLNQVKLFDGMHRFLPALFQIEGFRVTEIPVNHRERVQGQSKYNLFNRSFNTITDMFAVMWMRRRHLSYRCRK